MTTIRQVIKRDIGLKVEGVVKVFDRAALAGEIREYIVTDKIEEELKRIVDTFSQVSETIRRDGASRDVMGIWVSGFFGSGKSHFAKVLGSLLQNDELTPGAGGDRCIDAFVRHLSDKERGRDLRRRLGEIKLGAQVRTIAFEIKSRQSLINATSVGAILLSEFYRSVGLSEDIVIARIERSLERRGLLTRLAAAYETAYRTPWTEGRNDLLTVRNRLAKLLPQIDPGEHADEAGAREALGDMFSHQKITPEGIADELVTWVDAQKPTGGRSQHLVFVIDEMGTFIGDSNDRISELNSLAEMIGNKGKGRVWLVVTSQQDLEKVVDRTNFQPTLVGRLNARFELKPHLISDEINKVVAERILKKHPGEEEALQVIYRSHEGPLAHLADLRSIRHLGTLDERAFIDSYPFLPHQIQLAQDIFEALSGLRISGGVRSMISVVMDSLQTVADARLGTLVSFDRVYDAVENDLLSPQYLSTAGVRAIRGADEGVPGTPIAASRVLKILYLLKHAPWIPRIPETIAKLLVADVDADVATLRAEVTTTLEALAAAGYVARDEATGEWKYLNEQERTVEQAVQEMVRPGGAKSISIATVRRLSQQVCKDAVLSKKALANFTTSFGITRLPFSFGVYLDGEAVETGPDLEVHFTSPLAAGRRDAIDDLRRKNEAAGARGKTLWWVATVPETLEARFKRYEALSKVVADKRFTDDAAKETQDALAEKRKERDGMLEGLAADLRAAFFGGTLYAGGQAIELERIADLKTPLDRAFATLIPNLYPRFALADRPIDFGKQLKAILNPSQANLHTIAPDLALFDTQGNLQKDGPLVSVVLEVVHDLEDEGVDPTGATLLDAADRRGFRGFHRPPFHWPDELVRLLLAACFRTGALYVEQPGSGGPTPLYEFRGTEDLFAKINTFKKVTFRAAEESLSLDEVKRASKALIAMEVIGIPESGNAIARALGELGARLKTDVADARARRDQGLPIAERVLAADKALSDPTTHKDPAKAVKAFLQVEDKWRALFGDLKAIAGFLGAQRHKEFEGAQRLLALVEHHPVPPQHPAAARVVAAKKDMEALVAASEVIARWSDFRSAFDEAYAGYRAAYVETYDRVRAAVESCLGAVTVSEAYLQAPAPARDEVVARTFGAGRPCHYPVVALGSPAALMDAANRHSLSSLDQALVALPGYRDRIEAELRNLSSPPPSEAPQPDPGEGRRASPPAHKIHEWRPLVSLAGRTFRTIDDVESALSGIGAELKARIRDGYTVVVK